MSTRLTRLTLEAAQTAHDKAKLVYEGAFHETAAYRSAQAQTPEAQIIRDLVGELFHAYDRATVTLRAAEQAHEQAEWAASIPAAAVAAAAELAARPAVLPAPVEPDDEDHRL